MPAAASGRHALPVTEGVQERNGAALNSLPRAHSSLRERKDPPAMGWRIADAAARCRDPRGGRHRWKPPRQPDASWPGRVPGHPDHHQELLLLSAFGLIWPAVLSACGLYAPTRLREARDEWPRLLLAGAIGGLVALVFPLTGTGGAAGPEHALIFAIVAAPATALLRGAVRAARRVRRGTRRRQIIIVGSGPWRHG